MLWKVGADGLEFIDRLSGDGSELTAVGDELFFVVETVPGSTYELQRSFFDGESQVVEVVNDFDQMIGNLTAVDEVLFFTLKFSQDVNAVEVSAYQIWNIPPSKLLKSPVSLRTR